MIAYAVVAAMSVSPRAIEWTYLTSVGIGRSAMFGAGIEGSLGVLRWKGFPSSYSYDLAELRVGTFAIGNTRFRGGSIEGGLLFDVSSRHHASWGTFTLRVGAGYGTFDAARAPEGSVTLLYGVRSVLSKYGTRFVPGWYHEASIARLFGTYRRALRGEGYEFIVGIELSPTFFLPPVTWWRLAGGPPR